MRAACRLPLKDVRAVGSRAAAVMVVDEPDEDVDERESWLTLRKAMVDFLLIRKRLFPSQAFLQNMSVRGGPNVAKSFYLESLLARTLSSSALAPLPEERHPKSSYHA